MLNTEDYLNSNSKFHIIAGPCALESKEQLEAFIGQSSGIQTVRAGIFKMRTNPDSFQGLGIEGLQIIAELKKQHHFQFVTEITDPRQVEALDPVVDAYQVGSRNMYNYDLLRELNKLNKPVIFKRAFSATVKEWLNACGYMPDLGEKKIILCERGIRTFETTTRNCLDINSVVYLKQNHNFKVIVDPSHASGIKSMVKPLSHVAMAAGADGILVESHPNPECALSDKDQQITPNELNILREELVKLGSYYDKTVV
ncbi:MAG: 3-deoxy-7-phosphoheptulonate synthase [Bacteriovoracaceae bacterium]|jgi:3-deoxy-7-phosphoheptulonate synthase